MTITNICGTIWTGKKGGSLPLGIYRRTGGSSLITGLNVI
jgi:hypothetical protein